MRSLIAVAILLMLTACADLPTGPARKCLIDRCPAGPER